MTTAALKRPQAFATVHQQIGRIQAGLSFRAVQNLQKALDIPLETVASVLGMSQKAEDVFGDGKSAREWLTHKQAGLGKAVPLDFARTEIGAREVENLLGRLEYGVYS